MHQRKLAAQPQTDSTPKKFRKGYDQCPSCGSLKIRRAKRCRGCRTARAHPPEVKRIIFIDGEPCRLIPLTQGQYAVVDRDVYADITKYVWHALLAPNTGTFYARRNSVYKKGRKRKGIWMHRVIVQARSNEFYDHRNGNTLDNRRSNLRKCTVAENNCNTRLRKDNTSGHRGVGWYPKYGKWVARICWDDKRTTLGYFSRMKDAIVSRNKAAMVLHRTFARFDK